MLFTLYLIAFVVGLGIAVYAMLQGVTTSPTSATITRIVRRSTLSVAPFAVTFGAIGYLLTKHSSLSPLIVLAGSAAGAALTIFVSAPAIARVARRNFYGETEMQGQLAKVVTTVSSSLCGEIGYQRDGATIRQPAFSLGGGIFQPGRDVVVDRVEDGVAYVEDWESVERRL